MTLTKASIIEIVSEKNNLSPSESKETIEALLEIIKSALVAGDNIMVSGFGKFQVNEKSQRKGRNPATGEAMMLDKRRVVTFKCSGDLKDRINGGNG